MLYLNFHRSRVWILRTTLNTERGIGKETHPTHQYLAHAVNGNEKIMRVRRALGWVQEKIRTCRSGLPAVGHRAGIQLGMCHATGPTDGGWVLAWGYCSLSHEGCSRPERMRWTRCEERPSRRTVQRVRRRTLKL